MSATKTHTHTSLLFSSICYIRAMVGWNFQRCRKLLQIMSNRVKARPFWDGWSHRPVDRRTSRPTDRQTDRPGSSNAQKLTTVTNAPLRDFLATSTACSIKRMICSIVNRFDLPVIPIRLRTGFNALTLDTHAIMIECNSSTCTLRLRCKH